MSEREIVLRLKESRAKELLAWTEDSAVDLDVHLCEDLRAALEATENHPASQGEEREPDVEDAFCVEEFLRKVLSWEGSDEDELAEAIEAAEKLVGALDTAAPDSTQKRGQSDG